MSPKKSKRSQAAQQLIEDLLDEPSSNQPPHLKIETNASFGPIDADSKKNIVLDGDLSAENSLHLEVSQKVVLDPIARANKTAMFESRQRLAGDNPAEPIAHKRTPAPLPPPHENSSRPAIVDFGAMTADEEIVQDSLEERTMKVAAPQTLISQPEPRSEVIPITRQIDRGGVTEIRSGLKVPPAPRSPEQASSPVFSSSEAALKQSESLRIAQSRITDLERELERVRRDNESLSTAGDTLRRRADELASKAESFEIQARESSRMLDEEKKVMRGQLQTKDRENHEMRARVEEIETRLESNFKKIRVRERELEHRLEIVKMESATLISTKDKMILDLKRQIDQLQHEGGSAKNKTQELFNQYKDKQETIRRVVRALRIALTILEGDDESAASVKKVE